MRLSDIFIGVAGLQNANNTVLFKVAILETDFLNWMIWVGDKSISDENSRLAL